MTSLKIRLLDSLQVWIGDLLVPAQGWPTQKTKNTLKILLTERGHIVPAERLMDLLWPELSPSSAANSLRVAVSRLRRVLQPELVRAADSIYILTSDQGYSFQPSPTCWIDVDMFLDAVAKGQEAERRLAWGAASAAYQAAEALYQGDYLEENPYDDWAIAAREQLRVVHLDMLSRLAECHARQGHYRRGLAACRKALASDPLRESVYRQVMLYLYRLGERDQALRAYEHCRKGLAEALGADPLPETLDLYTRILREEALEEPSIAPAITPLPLLEPERRSFLAWLPFVGRQQEMARLAEVLQQAQKGQGRLVLLEGEVGVGKSRLAEEFLAYAVDQGAQVLQSRAYEPERDLSYQPLREALRRHLLGRVDWKRARQALGPWAGHVALLLPELRQFMPDLPLPPPVAAEEERWQLIDALTQFCLSLAASRPTVLFFDDLQWADPSTLSFLCHLVRHAAEAPLLVLGAYRSEELQPQHPLRVVERALLREQLAFKLHLQRLAEEAVAHLLNQRAAPSWDSAAFGRRLYEETEGSPLFVAEVLRNLLQARLLVEDSEARWRPSSGLDLAVEQLPLPATVQSVIEARCEEVGEPARRALQAAAVIGRRFPFNLLQRVAALDTDPLLDALDALVARQLIEEELGSIEINYHFSHDKIREVLYSQLSPARRRHLHGKVAATLEEMQATPSPEVVGQLAHHYEAADNEEKTVEYLLKAGDQARALYAHEEAIKSYGRVLAFLQRQGDYERAARTLMKLGLAHQIGFDFQRARQAYDEAFALWQEPQVAPQRAAPHPLRIGWSLQITTLDPNLAWDANSTGVVDQLFSGLAEHSPELEVIPDLARSWQVLDEGRRYLFHLRDDLFWSDGTPLTAEDFEFAWKRALDPATRSPIALLLYDIRGARSFHQGEPGADRDAVEVRALDPHTLSVELETPSAHFLQLLSHNVTYPVPRHLVEAHGNAWTDPATIVTNGPFRIVEWQEHEYVRLARNPRYRGRFRGNAQELELFLSADQQEGVALYDAGKLDVLRLDYPQGLGLERPQTRYSDEYISIPMLHTAFVGLLMDRRPLTDRRVRQALAQAIDRSALANVVFQGYVSPANGGFVPPTMPSHTPGLALPYDPARARQSLAQAGFPDAQGFPVLSAMATDGERWQLIARYLQRQWREVLGIESQWQTVEMRPGLFVDRTLGELPHVFVTGWFADYPDPDSFLRACPILAYAGWKDDRYASLVASAGQVLNQAQRMAFYRQADQRLISEAPIVPLFYGREYRLVKPWVKQLPTSPTKWWFWKDVIIESR